MANEDLTARVNKLEEVLTYQQQLVQELNDVIVDLRAQIDAVESRYTELSGRLKAASEAASMIDDRPERPPHY